MPMLKRCDKLRVVTEHATQHGHHAVGLLHKACRLREYHDIAVIPLRKQPCTGNRISHATIQILMPVNSNGTRRHRNRRRCPDPLDIALVAIGQVVVDSLARLDIGTHARKPHGAGAIRLQVDGIALDRHLVIGKIGIEHIAGPQPACYTRIALIGTIGLVVANGAADLARFKVVAKRRARRDTHHMVAGQTVLHPNVEHARRIHTAVAASLECQPHRARHSWLCHATISVPANLNGTSIPINIYLPSRIFIEHRIIALPFVE